MCRWLAVRAEVFLSLQCPTPALSGTALSFRCPTPALSDYLDDKVERLDDKVRQTHVSAESPWVGG